MFIILKDYLIINLSNQNAAKVRPGLKSGRSSEFTLVMPLKPGGAERMRKNVGSTDKSRIQSLHALGTVHEARFVIFDNDTRLLFASTFDGEWDSYIDDFASLNPDAFDQNFADVEGYPGIRSPDIKDWVQKVQVSAIDFFSAYPEASTKDLEKGLKIKAALDVLLDSATS